MDFVRLPLKGAVNVRDLGGYPTENGGITKFHTFIRSARLKDIDEADNEFLKSNGVTDIIDLRGNTDIVATFISDDNVNKEYFNHVHLPLSVIEYEKFSQDFLDKNLNLGEGYTYMLENKEMIKRIFEVCINAKGAVLFHCSMGKDRTGIVAAMLLGVCGVNEKDIIANYELTNTYVKDETFIDLDKEKLSYSKPEYIETFIHNLKDKYGSYEEYLISTGITKEQINILKNKFVQN